MRTQLRVIALLFPLAALALPTPAAAQWGYPPGGYYPAPESSLRVNVKPKQASVYVDGYFAGKVEKYDSKFERLHLLAGEHEVVVYLEGYRPLKQHVYLSPTSTHTIEGTLEKLAAGETQEPPPLPSERGPARVQPPDQGYGMPRPPRQMPRSGPAPQPPADRAPREAQGASRYASLSIRIQPGGTVVRIDGERWDGPNGDETLIVQVPEGHHTVEIEREGYEPFTTEVDVRRGETAPVNISLRRR